MEPSSFHICVVDDDTSLLTAVTRLLACLGHQVEAFASAAAFLERAPEPCACRLLLDISMPEIDGVELARQLQRAGRQERIVFMSASDDDEVHRRITEIGEIELVRKPFVVEQLLAALVRAQPLPLD